MVNWKYDLFLYVIGNLVDTFFREVVPRGSWRVPQTGPVLFVAAPHANQVSAAHVIPSSALPSGA
jgi:glycerol-3-phosphate O-acyltransferase / dihydroxyacetone phosphate acyltransferase